MVLKNLLSSEVIIAGAILSFLSWSGISLVHVGGAVASLQSSQKENTRVNEMVYNWTEELPKIRTTLENVSTTVNSNAEELLDLSKAQNETKARIYCMTTFPSGGTPKAHDDNMEKRSTCIEELVGK